MHYVAPVRLSEEEQELASLMSEPPTPYSEAVAFAAAVEQGEDSNA